jgi:hypothetical protein
MKTIAGCIAAVAVAIGMGGAARGAQYWYAAPGERMQAESWATLPAGAVVEDALAGGGKAVLLKRDGPAMETTLDLKCSYYALSVWARAAQENTYLPPAYLELTVGDKTYRLRLRYNSDRNAYLPGYNTSFSIDKEGGYEINGEFAKAKVYKPNPNGPTEWWGENTRFYFPVDAAGKMTLKLKMGARSAVDLLVDRFELRDVLAELPAGPRKTRRVLFSDEEQKAWELLQKRDARAQEFVEATRKRLASFRPRTDEQVWKGVPDPYMPRAQKGGPCPVHGDEVYRRGGMSNPWGGDVKPFHVTCLVGGEKYPSNAYEEKDLTSGEYADDGWGHFFAKSASSTPEDREMWFVGRRVYTVWQQLPNDIERMAQAYVITGDAALAHQAAVALAACAYHYPGYDYRFQSRQTLCGHSRGNWVGMDVKDGATTPIVTYNDWACGKVFYSGWTGGPDHELALMRAYDLLFPAIIKDEALLRFVGTKAPWVKTMEDLRALFDRRLLAVHADALIRRQARSANSGWEGSAALLGAIQEGPMAAAVLKELFTHANLDSTDAGGLEDAIVNMLCRDGVGLIYSPMYMFGWAQGLNAASDVLGRIPDDALRARYGMKGPKLTSRTDGMADFARSIRVAGQFLPNVGDTERAIAHNNDHFVADVWPMWLRRWKATRDPQFAALVMRYAHLDELLLNHAEDLAGLEADAKGAAGDLQQPSRVMGGYGAVVLESGYGQPDLAKKGAVFMPFGAGWGHSHADTLNIELFSRGYRILPDMGRNHGGSKYHNIVMVDGREQSAWSEGTRFGWLNHFAAATGIRFADLGARPKNYEALDRYRRAVAYVDAGSGNQYVFDVFQVKGGGRHTLGLNGPAASAFTCSEKLGPPGAEAKEFFQGSFKNPRQGTEAIAGPVTADWKFLFSRTARTPQETDVHLRATIWGAEGGRVLAADVTGDIPYDLTSIHLDREGKELASQFVTLMDPYEKEPFVKSARRLMPRGEGTADAAALEVTLADGRRDVIAYNGAPGGRDTQLARLPAQALDVAGEFQLEGVMGFVSRNAAGEVTQAMLVGGTGLTAEGVIIQAAAPEYRARVASVDYATGEVVLDKSFPAGLNLAGATVVIGSEERARAYSVVSLSADGARLRVKGSLLLFQSRVLSVDKAVGSVRVEFPFYQCKADPLCYNGCVAVNESGTARWRVKEVRRQAGQAWHDADLAVLEPLGPPQPLAPGLFDDADGDGRRLIYIYEIAPGYTARLNTFVSARRAADGKWMVESNVANGVR